MADPVISVIVPVFNNQQGINSLLKSLASQKFDMSIVEVLVIDNGSSPEVKLEGIYPFRLILESCDKPGAYSARNKGVISSRGKVLIFIDSDCYAEPDWIGNLYELLCSDTNLIIGGEVVFFPPKIRNGISLYQYLTGFQQDLNIKYRSFSATANLCCYRADFIKIGFFREDLLSGGDRLWCWSARNMSYQLIYAQNAVVKTHVRSSLSAAIRQTRRVTGGMSHIKNYKLNSVESEVAPLNNNRKAIVWLLRLQGVSGVEKIRIIMVAILLKAVKYIEYLRLTMGGNPERR
jgi:glycosyltransferase involved in cell wall biosynthesis